jgi:hypothetical protein
MRLGFIIEAEAVNSIYRALNPMKALAERGHEVLWPSKRLEDVPLRELARCDLVHCFRRADRLGDLEQLSRLGVAISYDNDDDFSVSELGVRDNKVITGLAARKHNAQGSKLIARAIRLADLTTTPSPVLAERYEAVGASRVAVIENHLDKSMFGFGYRSKHDGVVVAWVAALEHAADLPQLDVVGQLEQLLEAHPSLRVMSVGLRLPLKTDRYEHVRGVNHDDLLRFVSGVDIGIAPLADTPFNRGRSNVKLKEYSSGGAAWAASAVGPYRGLGAREGGVLIEDERWFEALDRMIRSDFTRKRLSRKALKWARSQTVDRFAATWEREFELAVERAKVRRSAG